MFAQILLKWENHGFHQALFLSTKLVKENCERLLNGEPATPIYAQLYQLSWYESFLARNLLIHHPNPDIIPVVQVYLRERDLVLERADKVRKLIDIRLKIEGKDGCINSIMKAVYEPLIVKLLDVVALEEKVDKVIKNQRISKT